MTSSSPVTLEVVHVVLVEWREDVAEPILAGFRAAVSQLSATIPGVLSVRFGESVSPEHLEQGYQWALVVTFVGTAARDGYLAHPAHVPVSTFIREHSMRVLVFDV